MRSLLVLLASLSLSMCDFTVLNNDYDLYCVGNCSKPIVTKPVGGVALMGGGTDVDMAFTWMNEKIRGGDFLVIRTDNDSLYDPYIYALGGNILNSAATLVILERSGSFESAVEAIINSAEAFFFAGGDQSTYYNNWRNSPVESALMAKSKVPCPFGGTSAGTAVLGQYAFTADYKDESVTSAQALADPYKKAITLSGDFFSFAGLQDIITDPHFFQRDRMGRLLTFMARIIEDGNNTSIHGIGIDEQTAVLVELNGDFSLVSWQQTGSAHFLFADFPPGVCKDHTPLTFDGIGVYRLSGNVTAGGNLFDWAFTGGVSYTLSADKGTLKSSWGGPYGPH